MARNKAIFDADIIINLVKTKSIDYILDHFEQIYISDYVFDIELKSDSLEKKKIQKLINKNNIKILRRNELTLIQKKIYDEAYSTLEDRTYIEEINEGERITASFASAHRVCYYMSDDNKAAPHIRTLTGVEVINFCDLLFISYCMNDEYANKLNEYYIAYINLYDVDKKPRIVMKDRIVCRTFPEMMARCFMKFEKNKKLSEYLKFMIEKRVN